MESPKLKKGRCCPLIDGVQTITFFLFVFFFSPCFFERFEGKATGGIGKTCGNWSHSRFKEKFFVLFFCIF